jgi:hypothetical protein
MTRTTENVKRSATPSSTRHAGGDTRWTVDCASGLGENALRLKSISAAADD